jgi:hypothetical protein
MVGKLDGNEIKASKPALLAGLDAVSPIASDTSVAARVGVALPKAE